MKNIPLFTSEYGLATLILEEIPTKGLGFIIIRSTDNLSGLLSDGVKFCHMCGAETVYATAEAPIPGYPLAYEILEFSAKKNQLPAPIGDLKLVPITAENQDTLLSYYEEAFRNVQGSGQYSKETQDGFLAYVGEKLVGIGAISEGKLEVIATLEPGMGYALATHLLAKIPEEIITLEVSSTNEKALNLYKKLKFSQTAVLKTYHKIQ
ncbi:MAG: hypothetical protein R3Y62_03205 [Eubacteriales bacterium]